jgi:hypothetical protein
VLEGEDLLLGRRRRPGLEGVQVDLLRADGPAARPADGHRLVLDDRMQPRRRALRIEPVRVTQEDLDRALVGVLGVIGADAVPAGETEHGVGMERDRRDDELLRLIAAEWASRGIFCGDSDAVPWRSCLVLDDFRSSAVVGRPMNLAPGSEGGWTDVRVGQRSRGVRQAAVSSPDSVGRLGLNRERTPLRASGATGSRASGAPRPRRGAAVLGVPRRAQRPAAELARSERADGLGLPGVRPGRRS